MRPAGPDAELVSRAQWALALGKRWSSVYWEEVLTGDGLEVNVAAVPLYLVWMVEAGQLAPERAAESLAFRSSGGRERGPLFSAYRELWWQAVNFTRAVRIAALKARACGDYAVKLLAEGELEDAFSAADQAYSLEKSYVRRVRYWHHLLYIVAEERLARGHVLRHPLLRR